MIPLSTMLSRHGRHPRLADVGTPWTYLWNMSKESHYLDISSERVHGLDRSGNGRYSQEDATFVDFQATHEEAMNASTRLLPNILPQWQDTGSRTS
jgi:hypothetical protein